jgi:hypothetical protein
LSEIEQRALARNDRFLTEFVETFDLCPFARRCRETGGLERRVLPVESADAAATLAVIDELMTDAFNHVEVALLIFPLLRVESIDFDRFASVVRQAHPPSENSFHVVAFHPDARIDASTPSRLTSFLRRSPDPTLQLVRARVLARVQGPNTNETVWMSSKDLKDLPKAAPPSLSERIAQQNFETVQRVGAEHLRELLADFRS